jgi:hypothetical protein
LHRWIQQLWVGRATWLHQELALAALEMALTREGRRRAPSFGSADQSKYRS